MRHLSDPLGSYGFFDVNLPFDISKNGSLDGETRLYFFQDVLEKFEMEEDSKVTSSDDFDSKTVFNHDTEALHEKERRKGRAKISNM